MKSRERNGINGKKSWKTMFFSFRMNMRKIRTVVRNGPEGNLVAAQKDRMTMWKFRTVMRNAPRRRKWCWWIFHFAQSCEIVGAHAKLHFSRFLGEKASRRPLRWCQVSTWPWPINKNLIYSFRRLLIHF